MATSMVHTVDLRLKQQQVQYNSAECYQQQVQYSSVVYYQVWHIIYRSVSILHIRVQRLVFRVQGLGVRSSVQAEKTRESARGLHVGGVWEGGGLRVCVRACVRVIVRGVGRERVHGWGTCTQEVTSMLMVQQNGTQNCVRNAPEHTFAHREICMQYAVQKVLYATRRKQRSVCNTPYPILNIQRSVCNTPYHLAAHREICTTSENFPFFFHISPAM